MTVVVITEPTVPLVSLAEAKRHLRVDFSDDDDLITTLIEVARSWIDAPNGWLGRALMKQTLELRIDALWHRGYRDQFFEVALPFPPLITLTSVKYDDVDGVEQTLDPATYRVIGGGAGVSRLVLAYGASWPVTRCQDEAVRVRFNAGYGETAETVPAAIRQAVLLLVAHLYENREAEVVGARAMAIELPTGVTALLSPFRVYT